MEDIEEIRVSYLGKKSAFNEILKGLKDLSSEEKKEIGPLANDTKKEIQHLIDDKKLTLESVIDEKEEWIDVTVSRLQRCSNCGQAGDKHEHGHLHPLSIVQRDIEDIFTSMGFEIADGPDIESESYNLYDIVHTSNVAMPIGRIANRNASNVHYL